MAVKLLMTREEVIPLAISNDEFDVDKLKDNHIDMAQEVNIRPVLGTDFYDDLLAKSPVFTDPNENTLIEDYIKPALAYYVKFESIIDIQYDITSLGARENTEDFSEPLSASQLSLLRTNIFRQATNLKDKMVRFLVDNDDDFPLYKAPSATMFKKSGIVVTDNFSPGVQGKQIRTINPEDLPNS